MTSQTAVERERGAGGPLPTLVERVSHRLESWPTWLVEVILCGLGALLIARLLVFTWLFSVNMPFSDQWAFLGVLFDGFEWRDIPAAFAWQHGPHRQGLSFALMVPVYAWSGWNVRLDGFIVACTQIAAGVLALQLRRRLVPGPWSIWDVPWLLGFWALNAFETIVVTSNNSHSIFPLLLVFAIAHVWIWSDSWRRQLVLIGLSACAMFTGFALAVAPALGLLLVLRVRRDPRQLRESAPIVLALAVAVWLFLREYQFVVAADNFRVMQPNPLDYLRFSLVMFNYFFLVLVPGVTLTYYPVGILFAGAITWVGLQAIRGLLRRETSPPALSDIEFLEICLLLCATTVTYTVLTAYGRVQLGMRAANTPRYVALMLPAFAAMLLWARRNATPAKRAVTMAVMLLLCLRQVPEMYQAGSRALYYANLKRCWFQQYLQSDDWQAATAAVQQLDVRQRFQATWMGTAGQWQYLKMHGLGPFAPGTEVTALDRFQEAPCEALTMSLRVD